MANILKKAVDNVRSLFRFSSKSDPIIRLNDSQYLQSELIDKSKSVSTDLLVPTFNADEISVCLLDESNYKFVRLLRNKSKGLNKDQKNKLIVEFSALLFRIDQTYGTNRYLQLISILKNAELSYDG